MKRERQIAEALADAFLAAEPLISELAARATWTLGRRHRWITPLCTRLFHRFGSSLGQTERTKLLEWIL